MFFVQETELGDCISNVLLMTASYCGSTQNTQVLNFEFAALAVFFIQIYQLNSNVFTLGITEKS